MALSRWEIKEKLGHGAAQKIADQLGVQKSVVSEVIAGKQRNRKVEVAIARKLNKPVDDVFAPRDGEKEGEPVVAGGTEMAQS